MAELLCEILDRCQRGDETAVRLLIERFHRSAVSLAKAILRDEHLAEDAMQNSFVTALRRLGQLRNVDAFPGWFRQIVRTESTRILRRRTEAATGSMSDVGTNHTQPEQDAMVNELRAAVREAVRQLPPAGEETVRLFYLEQRDCNAVANELQIPVGTVKRRLHDARQQLRSILLGYIHDETPTEPPEEPPEGLPL
ncbi:MAG: sigma-70 family RNA polymerase sigma factor [Phycisphaerae bacterium]|nr:sigma-70 family RNA polymerase sigma factor [Phycisphaerae bacterium]